MLTPQEVSSKTFPKAVMGGYAMAAVDEFLDALTEDYTNLYKETAALKTKVKTMMEQMEEYRQVEDAMRSTLLAAQRTAKEIVSEAEQKRDALTAEVEERKQSLVSGAETAARERVAQLEAQMAEEEQKLADTRERVAGEIAALEGGVTAQHLVAGVEGVQILLAPRAVHIMLAHAQIERVEADFVDLSVPAPQEGIIRPFGGEEVRDAARIREAEGLFPLHFQIAAAEAQEGIEEAVFPLLRDILEAEIARGDLAADVPVFQVFPVRYRYFLPRFGEQAQKRHARAFLPEIDEKGIS